jgi:peptidoglycan/xylan/chitin deacetylase (PgdA/CDA1 family)
MPMSATANKIALNGLHYSGAARLLHRHFSGVGALLTLHHICPSNRETSFSPNSILDITPEFLETAIVTIRDAGYEFISLDEFLLRMKRRAFGRPFVSVTIDDGYKDNFDYAYGVFVRHEVPFTIYICTGLMDGTVNLWWRDLEAAVAQSDTLIVPNGRGELTTCRARTAKEKHKTFNRVYWRLRGLPLGEQLELVRAVLHFNPCEIDTAHEEPLSWDLLRRMNDSGLLTIGAHTVNHYALSKLSIDEMRSEIDDSRRLIEAHTGVRPAHFAYPFGDARSAARREFETTAELGFSTAVTTRKGVVYPEHAEHLHALPRISLNGEYQNARYLEVFLTGLPFALHNGFRRCDVD